MTKSRPPSGSLSCNEIMSCHVMWSCHVGMGGFWLSHLAMFAVFNSQVRLHPNFNMEFPKPKAPGWSFGSIGKPYSMARRCISCIVVNTFPCSLFWVCRTMARRPGMGTSWHIICNRGIEICNWWSSVFFWFTMTCVSLGHGSWENLLSNWSRCCLLYISTHTEMEIMEGIFQEISGIGFTVGPRWTAACGKPRHAINQFGVSFIFCLAPPKTWIVPLLSKYSSPKNCLEANWGTHIWRSEPHGLRQRYFPPSPGPLYDW